jgi:prephenate dehydrogenase
MSAPAPARPSQARGAGEGDAGSLRGEAIRKLVIVGVGLIGGSCALALKRAGAVGTVVGIGRTAANLEVALKAGVVDRALRLDEDWTAELRDADMVLVAAPVAQYPALFAAIAPAVGPKAVVTDAGSTKQDVIRAARVAFGERIARFVPAHPVAGAATSGAGAASATLYDGRTVITTPLVSTDLDAAERVDALWRACGARVLRIDPEAHDRIFAAVSHLPHLLAFAFVEQLAARPDAAELFAQAGTGFRDFTRIAAASPEMWRDIALANHEALQRELGEYRGALERLAAALDARDGVALERIFAHSSVARRRWEAIYGAGSASEE